MNFLKQWIRWSFVLCFIPLKAQALSCVPLEMSDENLEKLDAVFIGKVTQQIRAHDAVKMHASLSAPQFYEIEISEAWKGTTVGEVLTIGRNNYWGDGYNIGQSYLIGAVKNKEGELEAPLCGLSYYYPTKRAIAEKNHQFYAKEQLEKIRTYFKKEGGK